MSTVRAKFRCNSVEQFSDQPTETTKWDGNKNVPSGEFSWSRVFRFSPQYDPTVPEDQRYAKYTPSGELRITVDNPAVAFIPGRDYYLDFTPVEEPVSKE